MEVSNLKVGDRVAVAVPWPTDLGQPRTGTIIELKKQYGLATIQWDNRDYLGFDISTRSTDVLRKVTA